MLPCYRLLSLGSSFFPFLFPHKILSPFVSRRSRWPRVSRHVSATAARMLGLRVRIPPGTWMSVSCECCVLSGKRFCKFYTSRPIYSQTFSLRETASRFVWPQFFRFLSVGTLKTPTVFWSNCKWILHRHIFNACQTTRNRRVTFEKMRHNQKCQCLHWFGFLFFSTVTISDKSSTILKSRTCAVNVLWQL
jgi:hypothetical protein